MIEIHISVLVIGYVLGAISTMSFILSLADASGADTAPWICWLWAILWPLFMVLSITAAIFGDKSNDA